MPFVSREAANISQHCSPLKLTRSIGGFDCWQLRARQEHSPHAGSRTELSHGSAARWFLPNGHTRNTARRGHSFTTLRSRHWFRAQGTNLSVLERRSALPVADFLLDRIRELGHQPRLRRSITGFQQAGRAALSRVSFVVLRSGSGRGRGKSLEPQRLHARNLVREVSWTRRKARGAERAGACEAVG